ncbi:MAG TPA: hypothetical protein VFX16_01450 [Pseudonocardiaceae bacterium]|nr:hypothetical protein [Pseudonocardiaceae bacterium]
MLGKALATLRPAVVVAYAVFGLFLAFVALFAAPGVASAIIRVPDLLAQLLYTPPLAGWSIWVAMVISARAGDVRWHSSSHTGQPALHRGDDAGGRPQPRSTGNG